MTEVERLYRKRPRSPYLRVSAACFVALLFLSWIGMEPGGFSGENVARFAGKVTPKPLRGSDFDFGVLADWAGGVMRRHGYEAALKTLAIAIAAIVGAGVFGGLLSPLAARTFATPEPYQPSGREPSYAMRMLWRAVVGSTRAFFIVVRAIPEYVWAFLLVLLFGQAAWAAVLALTLHNTGILGKLQAESIENLPRAVPGSLRALGAGRASIGAFAILPATFNRFLVYFLYRWETCVREATILGMLNIVSLGYWINLAHHARRYDEMVLLIAVGAAIVMAGDILSAVVRGLVRDA